MPLPTYQPRSGTLAAQMCEFFSANNDEELSRKEVAAKFSVPASGIDNSIKNALRAGVLATKESELDGSKVWCAGPNLPPPSDLKRWLTATYTGPAAVRAELPAAAALLKAIEKDVPLPAPRPRGAEFHAVWDRMEVGHSVPLDDAASRRLISNAQAWGKANGRKFKRATLDDGSARIWRTE